jgi:serine/threonine protein phosphatase 1
MKSDSEWLRQLPLSVEDARRFYVHAGIRPGIDLEDQTPDDLLWIRYEFLNEILPHPKLIVHGHTPQKGVVDVRNNRVAVDTACVFGYSLSAAVFSDDRSEPIDVIQVPCMDIKEKVNE